jgi:hypothetical protein
LIDLSVVIIQDERFYDFYLVDAGQGLLYAVLVGFPLVAFAVQPRAGVCLQQLIVISAAILICALITPAPGQLAPAVLSAVTGTVLSGLSLVMGGCRFAGCPCGASTKAWPSSRWLLR